MSEENIKKMLRAVLQSSKTGVSINRLQAEYQALCGETIPVTQLGFAKLEDYLRSIPSVVRLEHRMGSLQCFAAVCEETAHIADLVAKQKSSKKSGCFNVVNSKIRYKDNPYMLNVNPRALRQPSAGGAMNRSANHFCSYGGYRSSSAVGDYRQLDPRLRSVIPVERRIPASQTAERQSVTTNREEQVSSNAPRFQDEGTEQMATSNGCQSSVYNVEAEQSRLTLLLKKYIYGLWMSKLAETYSEMFNQKLHPQVLIDLEKWTHICMVEQPASSNRVDRLIYPPLPPRNSPCESSPKLSTSPISSRPSTPEQTTSHLHSYPEPKPGVSSKSPLARPTFIFPQQPVAVSSGKSSVTLRSPAQNPALQLRPCVNLAVKADGECKVNQSLSTATSNTLPTEVLQRITDLLSKYSQGIWAHALPQLFMDTYKMPFPEDILDNLSNYLHIWNVEYPMENNKKAILYKVIRSDKDAADTEESQQGTGHPLPSGLQVQSNRVPCLVPPSDEFSSVLVTDVKSSNAVTLRYVGENYSNAQEAMEESMRSFYSQSFSCRTLPNPVVGQLVAIRDGDEFARAQVIEIMSPEEAKVYYVDHGFSTETSGSNLLELHEDFLSLAFQATNVRLAGLEALSSHERVVSCLQEMALEKILLMVRLEPCQQNETPSVVLHDTSQDVDININSACLKALQEEAMCNPLCLNTTYEHVSVTNVCTDGIICCLLPSRGTARLSKLLEETEAMYNAQMSSELLVSRPFIDKICLARHKGQWSRAEVTNIYAGTRVTEILFIDFGVSATVEITDLREIPPPLLKDFAVIPPQVIKCRLADLPIPEDDWSPEVVQWLKETVLGFEDCKMKIVKLEDHKGDRLVHMYLFIGVDSQELDKSINHQLANSKSSSILAAQKTDANEETVLGLSALVQRWTLGSSGPSTIVKPLHHLSLQGAAAISPSLTLSLPLPLELPQPGQNMDVFVSVVCHPGYFVLQPWQDLNKLEVLTGEMVLYYNQTEETQSDVNIQKREVYAAKIDKNWHRVQVIGILTNGWVSVFELDYGRHELVRRTFLRPLHEEFRQLPFQAVISQLAGVTQHHWSEEACLVFRNHVEQRPLVAQVESIQEISEVKGGWWERKLTVYLVDTTMADRDLWIHSIMADVSSELSSAA